MKVLVLGASGATGKRVVRQLMKRQIKTRILIRTKAVLPDDIQKNTYVEIVKGNVSELNDLEMQQLLSGCETIISCLGHNMTLNGVFGNPRYLVFDAVKKVIENRDQKTDNKLKLILMSTTAYTNALAQEKHSIGEKLIFSLLNLLLPPHRDNVRAANYLVTEMRNEDAQVEWTAVRPDTLVNTDHESSYKVYESPVRSPIFNAGKTSRINVSHFIAELVTNESLWEKWKRKTPVIYNAN
ncbi:NAD(P)-dependent oxidoreductase [Amphibacillus jilinensis]|uniref:NAD(P)-dependent oxidoreductase n=1 Tax=Amphibacillus jilinensis TaxID=1216008 RepID=UPI0002D68A3D|nr:NAD(P)-binding oxidoreductase [Amphibacillus jilinensis]